MQLVILVIIVHDSFEENEDVIENFNTAQYTTVLGFF